LPTKCSGRKRSAPDEESFPGRPAPGEKYGGQEQEQGAKLLKKAYKAYMDLVNQKKALE
jgi:hypothetical protein